MSSSTEKDEQGTGRDRRAHVRRPASEIPSIRGSRLRHGPSVSLIDVSAGGALLEAEVQMKPGASLALEIATTSDQPAIVPMRVLRCELSALRPDALVYRGAVEFAQPLDLPELVRETLAAPLQQPPIGIDTVLKAIADRCRSENGTPLDVSEMLHLLRRLHVRAQQLEGDDLARPIADLLPAIVNALERRDSARVVLGTIESRLRAALPRLDIRLTNAPLPSQADGETILFRPDHPLDLTCVLNVRVPAGAPLSNWQWRLLQASMHLCSVLDAGGIRHEAESQPGSSLWQKLVVRYKDGGLVKGFSHDFHPTRTQFSIWPSINAAEHEGMVVPVSVLKAVFFVRDFKGNPSHVEDKSFDDAGHGRRTEVTFFDSEVLVGTTLSYRPDRQGFFLTPADPRANNLRVFVVTGAVRHVRFPSATRDVDAAPALQLVSA